MEWKGGDALVFKVANREHGGRVRLGDAFSCGGVARERMSVTCARGQRVKKVIVCGRRCECVSGLHGGGGGRSVSVLTPAGPGAEPGRAKHLVQARLERRVRLEVVRPRRHGLEGAAHCIRGGTRVRGDEGVDLAFSFVFI
jgi:hypothetical protein